MTVVWLSEKRKRPRRYTRSMSGRAAAIIQPVARNEAAATRYTESLTVAANSLRRFSLKSRAKKGRDACPVACPRTAIGTANRHRSEEHTSELQSRLHLVCRLL